MTQDLSLKLVLTADATAFKAGVQSASVELKGLSEGVKSVSKAADDASIAQGRLNQLVEATRTPVERLKVQLEDLGKIAPFAATADQAEALKRATAGLEAQIASYDEGVRRTATAQAQLAQVVEQTRTPVERLRATLGDLEKLRPFASSAENALALDRATGAVQRSLEKAIDAEKRHSTALKLSFQDQEILRSGLINTAQSIAAGLPVMDTLLVQGMQTAPVLLGVGAGLAGVAAGVITAGAAVVATAAAWDGYVGRIREVQRIDALMGGGSGTTAGQRRALAESAASAGQVSTVTAANLQGALISNQVGPALWPKITGMTRDFAAAIGSDTATAGNQLAAMFGDPAKAADDLAKAYNLLSSAELDHIHHLADQGSRTQAQIELADKLAGRIKGLADNTGWFSQKLEKLGVAASNAWDKLGKTVDRAISGPTADERIAQLEAKEKSGPTASGGAHGVKIPGGLTRDEAEELARLKEKKDRSEAVAKDLAELDKWKRDSLDADPILKSLNPPQATLDQLKRALEKAKSGVATGLMAPNLMPDQGIARLQRQVDDYQKAVGSGLTLEEEKRRQLLDVERQAAGMSDPAARDKFLAQERAKIDLFGTATTAQERQRASLDALRQVEAQLIQGADGAFRALNPDAGTLRDLRHNLDLLGAAKDQKVSADLTPNVGIGRLRQQVDDYQKAVGSGLTLEEEKRRQLLNVERQAAGMSDPAARDKFLAQERAKIDLFGTATTAQERQRASLDALRQVEIQLIQTQTQYITDTRDQVADTLRLADAWEKGANAARVASVASAAVGEVRRQRVGSDPAAIAEIVKGESDKDLSARRAQFAQMAADQRQSSELASVDYSLLTAESSQRARLLAMRQTEIDLQAKGADLAAKGTREYVQQAGAAAAFRDRLQENQRAASAGVSALSDAVKTGLLDPTAKATDILSTLGGRLKQIAADAVMKPVEDFLTGAFAQLMTGAAPIGGGTPVAAGNDGVLATVLGVFNGGVSDARPMPVRIVAGPSAASSGNAIADLFMAAGRQYKVDPATLYGLWGAESSFGEDLSTSKAGAKGQFQFLPRTWGQYGGGDPNDLKVSLDHAAHYLSDLVAQKGSMDGALAAYGGFKTKDPSGYIAKIAEGASQFAALAAGGGAAAAKAMAEGGQAAGGAIDSAGGAFSQIVARALGGIGGPGGGPGGASGLSAGNTPIALPNYNSFGGLGGAMQSLDEFGARSLGIGSAPEGLTEANFFSPSAAVPNSGVVGGISSFLPGLQQGSGFFGVGSLSGWGAGIGMAGSLIGNAVGGRPGSIISGASQGAAMGSMFGPWGMGIGAVAGGLVGALSGGGKQTIDPHTNDVVIGKDRILYGSARFTGQINDLMSRYGLGWTTAGSQGAIPQDGSGDAGMIEKLIGLMSGSGNIGAALRNSTATDLQSLQADLDFAKTVDGAGGALKKLRDPLQASIDGLKADRDATLARADALGLESTALRDLFGEQIKRAEEDRKLAVDQANYDMAAMEARARGDSLGEQLAQFDSQAEAKRIQVARQSGGDLARLEGDLAEARRQVILEAEGRTITQLRQLGESAKDWDTSFLLGQYSPLNSAQQEQLLRDQLASLSAQALDFGNTAVDLTKVMPKLLQAADQLIQFEGNLYGSGSGTIAQDIEAQVKSVAHAVGLPGFAGGGLITGGTRGVDSVPIVVMPGERVLSYDQSRLFERFATNQSAGDPETKALLKAILAELRAARTLSGTVGQVLAEGLDAVTVSVTASAARMAAAGGRR